jgi:hypothetical protein
MGVGGQRHAPAALLPGKTRYRRPGGPKGRSGRVRKISPTTGIRSRNVQPVASSYTDYAIPGHFSSTVNRLKTNYTSKCKHVCNKHKNVKTL